MQGAVNRKLADERRVKVLYDLEILDTDAERQFDEIAELASIICGTPIALVSLIEYDRQWFKSRVGINVHETPRDVSFCDFAIRSNDVMVVPDASKDARFCENPLVTGDLHVRFYAGAPLTSHEGVNIGTLCVIDRVPREMTEDQSRALAILSRQVMARFEMGRLNASITEAHAQFAATVALAQESEHLLTQSLGVMNEGFVVQDVNGAILLCNDRACDILGLSRDQLCQRASIDPRWRCIREDGSPFPGEEHPAMIAIRNRVDVKDTVMGVHHADGRLVWININVSLMRSRRDNRLKGVLCTFTDITQRCKVEADVRKQVAELQATKAQLERQRRELEDANQRLQSLAASDGLTGLLNQRMFQQVLELGPARGGQLSLLLIDVDEFKEYNDSFGHVAGDDLLRQLAGLLSDTIRDHDQVFRCGGDEFAVVMPIGIDTAMQVAKRIVDNVRKANWEHRPVTVSIGVAWASELNYSDSKLAQRADAALYQTKARGRDGYCRFVEPGVVIED